MSEWYKMNPIDWNRGTDSLTLEQEAAYLRICNAIYISGGPIAHNHFVLSGLFRCNDRKAKRLLSELSEAGKVAVENGSITNRRALDELSNRDRVSVERQLAGNRGGVESGNARRKPLKNGESSEANASSKTKQIREDKNREDISPSLRSGDRAQAPAAPSEIEQAFEAFSEVAKKAGLPVPRTLTKDRRDKLASRLKEHGFAVWREAIGKLEASSFCRGANDRAWVADIDFMLQPSTFNRLVEGKYDDREPKAAPKPASNVDKFLEAIRIAEEQENESREREGNWPADDQLRIVGGQH